MPSCQHIQWVTSDTPWTVNVFSTQFQAKWTLFWYSLSASFIIALDYHGLRCNATQASSKAWKHLKKTQFLFDTPKISLFFPKEELQFRRECLLGSDWFILFIQRVLYSQKVLELLLLPTMRKSGTFEGLRVSKKFFLFPSNCSQSPQQHSTGTIG